MDLYVSLQTTRRGYNRGNQQGNNMKRSNSATPKSNHLGLERQALRMNEAAQSLGISRSAVYALVKAGKLKYIRLDGGSRRIPVKAIVEFIEESVVSGHAA